MLRDGAQDPVRRGRQQEQVNVPRAGYRGEQLEVNLGHEKSGGHMLCNKTTSGQETTHSSQLITSIDFTRFSWITLIIEWLCAEMAFQVYNARARTRIPAREKFFLKSRESRKWVVSLMAGLKAITGVPLRP